MKTDCAQNYIIMRLYYVGLHIVIVLSMYLLWIHCFIYYLLYIFLLYYPGNCSGSGVRRKICFQ